MVLGGQVVELMTVRDVARVLQVHPNTLRRWSDKGVIKAYHITPRGDRRFMRQEVTPKNRLFTEVASPVGRNAGANFARVANPFCLSTNNTRNSAMPSYQQLQASN